MALLLRLARLLPQDFPGEDDGHAFGFFSLSVR